MRNARLIELSLQRTHIERLIICLGYTDARAVASPSAVALRTAQALLQQCKPAASDVHDPSLTRARGRDARGRARAYYGVHDNYAPASSEQHLAQHTYGRIRRHRRSSGATHAQCRTPQTWDSQAVPDYMGLWCDRLLLGDYQQPRRCALFVPQVPPSLYGEAVSRVAHAHRNMQQDHVLVITASANLPLGVLRQTSDMPMPETTTLVTPLARRAMEEALLQFAPSTSALLCNATLQIGVGAEATQRGGGGGSSVEDEARMSDTLIPLSAFAAALWATNAEASASYVKQLTPTAQHLTRANSNVRLWRTMQAAMLSTRDAALLTAYYNKTLLDPRLSARQTTYLAETLLQRLGDRPDVLAGT